MTNVLSHMFSLFYHFYFVVRKETSFTPITFYQDKIFWLFSNIWCIFIFQRRNENNACYLITSKKIFASLDMFLFWDVRIWCNEWIYNISQYQDWSNLHPVMHFHKSLFAANLSLSPSLIQSVTHLVDKNNNSRPWGINEKNVNILEKYFRAF